MSGPTIWKAQAARLALSGLLLASITAPAAQLATAAPISAPTRVPYAQLMRFTPDAYPRQTAPVQRLVGGKAIQTYPLKTTILKNGEEVLADRLIIRYAPTTTDADRTSANNLAASNLKMAARPVGQLSATTFLVDVSGATSLEDAARAYRADPRVLMAGPDPLGKINETPNDPLFGQQWGMQKIQAPAAWNRSHGAPGAGPVAILDSGIDETHPELAGRIDARADFTGSGSGTTDVVGHGTMTAGIVAASTNNGMGVAGMGYNVDVLNGKVADDSGQVAMSSLVEGINWAVANGARVINMSVGAGGEGSFDDCDPAWYEELADAGTAELVDATNDAWNSGVIMVASAGNHPDSFPQWPASCPHVMSVANTQFDDSIAPDSTRGTWVNVAAPGTGILSTAPHGSFATASGTSFSSPLVAGLVALVRASCPSLTNPQDIFDRVANNSDAIAGTGTLWHSGRVDALQSVCFPPPIGLRAGTVSGTSIQVLWSDQTPGESRFDVSSTPATGGGATIVSVPANTTSFTQTGVPAGASFIYQVRACDAFGCSDWTPSLTVQSNTRSLSVSRSGTGSVKGTGINCGSGAIPSVCSAVYPYGTVVTLTATGFANPRLNIFWSFDHWENACTGSGACTLSMIVNRAVKAVFLNES